MLLFLEPSPETIAQFLGEQETCTYSYAGVGGTEAGSFPHGFTVDHNRILLGSGDRVWNRAIAALENWTMFHMSWCKLTPARPAIVKGTTVAIAFRHYGFWSLNSARIVYTVNETNRKGFAYGTLPGHSESGEERFQIERANDGEVYYDLLAFSQPRDLLPRLAKPLARGLQRRFVQQSMAAMKRAAQG